MALEVRRLDGFTYSSELEGILALSVGAGDGDDLVGAESLGPKETEVAELQKMSDSALSQQHRS